YKKYSCNRYKQEERIVDSRLSDARRKGLQIRKEETSGYSLRWENERTFAILEDITECEYI
ncbi:MAG: hypothetical protein ACP5G6_09240, partial [Conexivisphaera sp.]